MRDFKLYEALSISEDDIILMTTTFDPVAGRLRIATLIAVRTMAGARAEAYGFSHKYELTPAPADLLEPREAWSTKPSSTGWPNGTGWNTARLPISERAQHHR